MTHSETIKLENKNIENLVNKTYQDVLIKISQILQYHNDNKKLRNQKK